MLFDDFEAIHPEEWKNLILKTIKADTESDRLAWYEEKLIRYPEPGIQVHPFYTAECIQELDYLKGFHRLWTQARQTIGWMNVQAIHVAAESEANAQAKEALTKGAEAVQFRLPTDGCVYATLLDGLSPVQTPLFFSGSAYASLLAMWEQRTDKQAIMGGVVNPTEIQTAAFCQQTPHFRMLFQADTPPESLVDELDVLLRKAMQWVDRALQTGLPAALVLPGIGFMTHTDHRYFLQIAKLRALRLLWWQIGRLYDPALNLVDVFVYATVQAPPPPAEEPYKSLISNTTQAMSAIVGGCDALSVVSTLSTDSALGTRMARTISVILREEAYLDAVTDIGAGSFLIESLTHQLAKATWERVSTSG